MGLPEEFSFFGMSCYHLSSPDFLSSITMRSKTAFSVLLSHMYKANEVLISLRLIS